MAKLSVSVDVPLAPETAWEFASDLSRYKEWLTIHRVWRSKLPEALQKGTVLDSIVEVKGMANRIRWTIVNYQPPKAMTLNGDGRGGRDGDIRRTPRRTGVVRPDRHGGRRRAQGRHPRVTRQIQIGVRVCVIVIPIGCSSWSARRYGTGRYYGGGSMVGAVTRIADRAAESSQWS